jgi:hypothetical protein
LAHLLRIGMEQGVFVSKSFARSAERIFCIDGILRGIEPPRTREITKSQSFLNNF